MYKSKARYRLWHYGCGGIKAANGESVYWYYDNRIRHIKDVYRLPQ
jgi:carbonic anhydrase